MSYIIPVIMLLISNPVDDDYVKPMHRLSVASSGDFINPVADLGENYDSDYEWTFEGIDSPITYREIREQAIANCKNRKPEDVDEDIIDILIEVERSFGVPPGMRGMILAAACYESGYNPNAKGDRKFSKSKKKAMAIGILQQWRVYEKAYGTNRTDPRSAAQGWMKHIAKKISKVTKRCKFKTDERIWLAAWVTGVRKPKAGGRCYEKPKHYKLLKKWHRKIRKNRDAHLDSLEEPDGC